MSESSLEGALLDASDIQKKMEVLRTLGHPYSDEEIAAAPPDDTALTQVQGEQK